MDHWFISTVRSWLLIKHNSKQNADLDVRHDSCGQHSFCSKHSARSQNNTYKNNNQLKVWAVCWWSAFTRAQFLFSLRYKSRRDVNNRHKITFSCYLLKFYELNGALKRIDMLKSLPVCKYERIWNQNSPPINHPVISLFLQCALLWSCVHPNAISAQLHTFAFGTCWRALKIAKVCSGK